MSELGKKRFLVCLISCALNLFCNQFQFRLQDSREWQTDNFMKHDALSFINEWGIALAKLSTFLLIALVLSVLSSALFPLVSSASGNIGVNGRLPSSPGQQVIAGGTVNLYFGQAAWSGDRIYLLMSHDNNPEISVGDLVYTPSFYLSQVANPIVVVNYTNGQGVWLVGNNWINGTIAQNVPVGNYTIKAFDQASSTVAVTDVFVMVNTVIYSASLQANPPSGPGGVPVQFSGNGFPPSSPVTISYLDSSFGTWKFLMSANADALGRFTFTTEVPDLKQSLRQGDFSETFTRLSYRAEINGVVYCYADYDEFSRGLKMVANQTATGLWGNGTNLSSTVTVVSGGSLTISGKWFHPNDVVYVRWDGAAIVGTVTGDQWRNAAIIGNSISNSAGYFFASATVPVGDAGEHYLSIEDSQTRVIIKIYMSSAYLFLSPASGPGGVSVQFSGTSYPPSTPITISYQDPTFGTWNPLGVATSNSTGAIQFSAEMPDLRRSAGSYDYPETTNPISFRTESQGKVYCYATYSEYSRGLKIVGGKTANGLYGNGTNLASTVIVLPGDSVTISGKWFHPNDVVYIRWDGASVVGTVTGDQWRNAAIIGTSISDSSGSFDATAAIPAADVGQHFISVEDSQTKIIIKVALGQNSPPPPVNRMPSIITLSCSSSTSYTGLTATITGKLMFSNLTGISGAPVFLSSSINGGASWQNLTLVYTGSDGFFSAQWMPSVSGSFLVKAEYSGTSYVAPSNQTVTLALAPYSNQNVFSVTSNSTVSALSFDSVTSRLNFTVTGASGTAGFVDVGIAKSLIPNSAGLRIYVDGSLVQHTVTSTSDSWLVHFSYTHSTHSVSVEMGQPVIPEFFSGLMLAALVIFVSIFTVALSRKTRRQ